MSETQRRLVWTTEKVKEAEKKLDDGYILKGYEIPFFEKKPGLRKAGISFSFSDFELEEYLKCKLDITYFIENYCFVKSEDGLYHKMSLRDYQYDIVDLFKNNKMNILMASRQVGKCMEFNTPLYIYNKRLKVYRRLKFFQVLFKYKRNKTIYDYIKYGIYTLINLIDG